VLQNLQRDLVPVDAFTLWQLLQLGQTPVEDLGDDASTVVPPRPAVKDPPRGLV